MVKRVFSPSWAPLLVLMAIFSLGTINGWSQQRAALELQNVKQSATQTTVTLSGTVKNISPSDISGVTVYCDFQGTGGKTIRTEETQFEQDPLKVNETTNFSCSTKMSSDIKGYNFRFVRLFGGPLAFKMAPKK